MPNRGADQVPDFVGFANAPVDDDGNVTDFRDVPAYDAERDEAIAAPSSITAFKTDDKSTDGFPMAVVPAPVEDDVDFEDFLDGEVDEADEDPAEGEEG